MKVLVTGGSGFLGAWIVKRLAKSGHQIRIFDIAANKSLVAEIAGSAVPMRSSGGPETSSRPIRSMTPPKAATPLFTLRES